MITVSTKLVASSDNTPFRIEERDDGRADVFTTWSAFSDEQLEAIHHVIEEYLAAKRGAEDKP